MLTVFSFRWRQLPAVLVIAAYAMSVPIAVVGLTPKRRTSSGVIREPPPMPVMPTRNPTPKPKKTILGSIETLVPGERPLGRTPLFHLVPFYDRVSPKRGGDHSGSRLFPLIAGFSSAEWR